jgi:hypothetical protein
MKAPIHLIKLAMLAIMFSSSVAAQTEDDYHPFLSDKFNLDAGAFFPNISYTLRVDGITPGDEIDFDEALNLEDYQATPSINFRWRFGKKWSFWGQYWDTSTHGGFVLTEDTTWKGVTFKEGTFANTGIDLKVVRVFFGREFSVSPKHEFGLGLGLHWMELGSFLEGEVIIDENTTDFQRVKVGTEFPLPNIGGWYMYSWSPKWIFQSRLDWLSASIGDYSGSQWDIQAGVNYQMFKTIGIGLYYKAYLLDVDVDRSDFRGKVEMDQYGPLLTLTATW